MKMKKSSERMKLISKKIRRRWKSQMKEWTKYLKKFEDDEWTKYLKRKLGKISTEFMSWEFKLSFKKWNNTCSIYDIFFTCNT